MQLSQTHSNGLISIDEIEKNVGNTPLHSFRRQLDKSNVEVFAKLEWKQIGKSVKARAAFSIIKDALLSGKLHHGKELLDATSGNTGIAYASICSKIGIQTTLCIPENASKERKEILKNLGAHLIYTSKFELTEGAQKYAKTLYEQNPNRYFYADQYSNDRNWKSHYYGTAEEIFKQTQGKITHFVSGLGTTGTFVGTVRKLKELKPSIQAIALQPDVALHGLEGWKHLESAGVPKIYDSTLADDIMVIRTEEAYQLISKVAQSDDFLLSPSSAANLLGAFKVAQKIKNGIIVTVLPDDAEKYNELMKTILR